MERQEREALLNTHNFSVRYSPNFITSICCGFVVEQIDSSSDVLPRGTPAIAWVYVYYFSRNYL